MSPDDNFRNRIDRVARDVRLHYVLPQHSLTPLLQSATLSAEEVRVPCRPLETGNSH
jgi:hypothetical protein